MRSTTEKQWRDPKWWNENAGSASYYCPVNVQFYDAKLHPCCIPRPTPWQGQQDGLPPVGTECEIDTRFGWLPGKIVDHGDDYAVAHLHENEHNLKVDWSRTGFRPIQSERDKATYELARELGDLCPMPEVVSKVIDLGYRKPISRAEAFDLVVDIASSGDSMTCPECNGDRSVLSGVTGGPDGPIEHFEECGTCGGQGVLEVDINQILDALGYKD